MRPCLVTQKWHAPALNWFLCTMHIFWYEGFPVNIKRLPSFKLHEALRKRSMSKLFFIHLVTHAHIIHSKHVISSLCAFACCSESLNRTLTNTNDSPSLACEVKSRLFPDHSECQSSYNPHPVQETADAFYITTIFLLFPSCACIIN